MLELRRASCQAALNPMQVTLCFMDVVTFTSMAAELHPSQVMLFLNGIFSELDALVEEHGVYKVETIVSEDAGAEGCQHAVHPVLSCTPGVALLWQEPSPEGQGKPISSCAPVVCCVCRGTAILWQVRLQAGYFEAGGAACAGLCGSSPLQSLRKLCKCWHSHMFEPHAWPFGPSTRHFIHALPPPQAACSRPTP